MIYAESAKKFKSRGALYDHEYRSGTAMRRMRELINAAKLAHPDDTFFDGLRNTLSYSSQARAVYRAYDRALSYLDTNSWGIISDKSIEHFLDHRDGQLKQGFFNQLNEAFAYQFLARKGFNNINILREDGSRKPDIGYCCGEGRRYCEVKTISVSKEEIDRICNAEAFDTSIYKDLSVGFLNKFTDTLNVAYRQICSQHAEGLIFVIVKFDDFTLAHIDRYQEQISQLLISHDAPEIFVKVGLIGGRSLHKRNLESTHDVVSR